MTEYYSWSRFLDAFKMMVPYLSVTFKIVFWASVFGVLFGIIIAEVRIHKIPFLKQISYLFVSFMRGTPLLVQMMLVYYGLPLFLNLFGVDANRWDKLIFAFIAYSMNQAAFLSEMFRSGIEAVPAGQREAGYSVGLTKWQTFQRIVFPQAVGFVIPPFGSDLVGLFQGTSLVYLLGVIDIMGRAKSIGAATGHYIEAYVVAIVIYVIISMTVKGIFASLSRRQRI